MKESQVMMYIGGKERLVRHVEIEKGEKVRVYPMQMRRELDLLSGDWIYNPEKVKKFLTDKLKVEHPTWIAKEFRLDPGLHNILYRGKPIIPTDELVLVVVLVPDTEDDILFTSEREVHFR